MRDFLSQKTDQANEGFLDLEMAYFFEGYSIFGHLTVPQRAMSLSNSQMA